MIARANINANQTLVSRNPIYSKERKILKYIVQNSFHEFK